MIVITGATGALNGATVEHLLKRIPADQIAVSVRDIPQFFTFPTDMGPVAVETNRLNNQVLVRYYEKEFDAISR